MRKQMTKARLISVLASELHVGRLVVADVLDRLARNAVGELVNGVDFVVPGIVRLKRVERKARKGRNPATGAEIEIPAKMTVRARVVKALKDAVGGEIR